MSENRTIRFRVAGEADVAALVELINRAFGIETFLEGTRTDAERLRRTMEKGWILLAEERAGEPLGSVYMERRGERGYLGMLAVTPERQGTMLAFRLAREAEARFRAMGCGEIEISVLSQRPELVPLYKRFGFEEKGTEAFGFARELKDGVECHEILMRKRL